MEIYLPKSVGGIYNDTVMPYNTNFKSTKVGDKKFEVDRFKLKGSIQGVEVSADWNVHRVIEEAKKAGFKNVHFIDEYNFNILGFFR